MPDYQNLVHYSQYTLSALFILVYLLTQKILANLCHHSFTYILLTSNSLSVTLHLTKSYFSSRPSSFTNVTISDLFVSFSCKLLLSASFFTMLPIPMRLIWVVIKEWECFIYSFFVLFSFREGERACAHPERE